MTASDTHADPEPAGRVPTWWVWVGALLATASLVALGPRGSLIAGQTATAGVAALVVLAARHRFRQGPQRSWRPWYAAAVLFLTGAILALVGQSVWPTQGSWISDPVFVAAVAMALVGAFRMGLRDARPSMLAQSILDAVAMAMAVVLVGWLMLLDRVLPGVVLGAGDVLLLLYPAGIILLASVVLILALRVDRNSRAFLGWVALAMITWTAGALLFAVEAIRDVERNLFQPAWAAGYAFLLVGLRAPRPRPTRSTKIPAVSLLYPYLPVVLALPAVLWTIITSDGVPLPALIIGPLVFLVIIARQILALFENRALLENLRGSEEQRSTLIEQSTDLILMYRRDGPLSFASPAAREVLGYAPEELVGQHFRDLVHKEDRAALEEAIEAATGTPWQREIRCRRRDGDWAWISMRGRSHERDGKPWIVVTLRDETERRRLEEARKTLERNIQVRALINRALVEATEEPRFLQEACEALVNVGGYSLAWVGTPEEDGAVKVTASAGAVEYLQDIQIRWDDTQEGRGPTGRAIRDGIQIVVHNIAKERRYGPWRKTAARHGHVASAAFPLDLGGGERGALNVYSKRLGSFDEEERGLLDETAGDIGYGIRNLRDQKARRRAEKRIADQRETMLAAEALAHVGSWAYDLQNDEYTVSDEVYRIFGFPPDRPLSLGDLEEALHPDDRDRILAAREQLISGSDYDETYRILRTDGAVRWVRSRARLRPGPEAETIVGQVQDITEQVEAERGLQRQEEFMARAEEAAQLASWEWDSKTNESGLSENGYALFGLDPDEPLQTEQIFGLMHEEDLPDVRRSGQQALAKGTPHAVEFRFRRDGELRWGRIDAVAAKDDSGEPRFLRGVVQDITARKAAEDATREREVREQELQRLEEMNEFRTQFMNTAAHELNQPITPLALETDLLRKGVLGPLNDKQARAMELLDRNLTRISLLVQDMLDAARMQGGRLKLVQEVGDVAEVVRDAADTFSEQARQSGVRLVQDLRTPLPTLMDRRRIMQVASNLIHNAIKFTDEGGTVTVTAQREGDDVVVTLQDTGIGLTEGQMERLFQPFVQVHEIPPKGIKGTGLGLYISQGIVEQHGGSLTASSPGPDKGATFTFRLPVAGPDD